MRLALAFTLAVLPGLAAAERVAVRAGDHPGHGRLVFDWPAPPAYGLDQQGEQVLLRFPPGTEFQLPRKLPRNLLAAVAEGEGIRLTLRPRATARHFRLGGRVVVDLLDPLAEPARQDARADSGPASRPAPKQEPRLKPGGAKPPMPAPGAGSGPVAAEIPPVRPHPARPADAPPAASPEPPRAEASRPEPPPAAPSPAVPPTAAAPSVAALPPASLPARLLAMPNRVPALQLPFAAGTGAALLRRGEEVLAVFDTAAAPDLVPLRGDPVFGGLRAEALPGATLLRLPLAAPAQLRARREAAGWVLEAVRTAAEAGPPGPVLATQAEAGPPPRLVLTAAAPGRVVPVTDPETGLPLLVGTLREGREAVPIGRRLPELDLPPTTLGVAVLARSDGIALQPGNGRFLLTASGGTRLALDVDVARADAGPTMTRSFELPTQPVPELLARLQSLQAGIAGAPPLGRMPQRRAAGETLLALGLPQEAQAMLLLGYAEDPRAGADPRYTALSAAAALLAGRLGETAALAAPGLAESDEAVLWRAALAAAQGDWRLAGPGFSATLPLLLAYPEPLRARLLPRAALALAESGDAAALGRLLAAAGPAAEGLALSRAILAETEGKAEEALAGYDAVAAGRDRQSRARAIRRAVELRLASGRMDAAQAAKTLEAVLFAWRGDAAELEARLRLAALRRESGNGRGALALLQETATMVPEHAAALQPALRDSFLAALADAPPLAAVALFDAYPALLPVDQRGEAAVQLLVERLVGLDLGDRAATLLRQAMEQASGVSRSALGLRLAALRLEEGDAAGTLAALAGSATADMPSAMQRDRAVLAARAEARLGRAAEAIAALRALGPAGGEALSQLLAEQADWAGAAAALDAHIGAALPASPAPLDDAQRRLLLRQASLLALAGDESGLAALRDAAGARMGEGPPAEAFRLLTVDPLRGLADLPRLQRELQLFRNLPSRLEALRAGASLTR
ncbi:hypothetical protein E2C06_14445 [Dankookia rubra]|uniref:Tetratricopeptide repeat protein n=1 Tax=Dankookia rubra TaxID=1442381 RepID=A0A4R5QH56_9PROT|nr:hypothetical protein [Dankookia rubra]TDH61941.1 hypothetical protein E2C06_14445 [Dankookia rubra]